MVTTRAYSGHAQEHRSADRRSDLSEPILERNRSPGRLFGLCDRIPIGSVAIDIRIMSFSDSEQLGSNVFGLFSECKSIR